MSGFPILDLVLGLIFIYFVLSIICSAVVESILTTGQFRAKLLTRWLMSIFNKEMMQPNGSVMKLGQSIADHCLTTVLSGKGRSASFIDAKNFTTALFEKLSFDAEHPEAPVPANLDELLKRIEAARAIDGSPALEPEFLRTLVFIGNEARLQAPESLAAWTANAASAQLPSGMAVKNSLQVFKEKLEAWFDSNMDRLTGALKKKYVRPLTFWIGLIVVVMLNVDTLQVASYLYDHKEETARFADRAQMTAQHIEIMSQDSNKVRLITAAVDSMRATVPTNMPLGWTDAEQANWMLTVRQHAIGWLATVMAIMLGAPFWFDLLNKIANLRGSGSKPVSSTDAARLLPGTSGK
ncbi:MAG: hypothetical protein JST06_10160 [Bacteroidetes bacterium]|nr:hypothetical protein [Bacteroidota bacterium]MBS1630531.1 hypothetical protein [Bacteroidota bacterium]